MPDGFSLIDAPDAPEAPPPDMSVLRLNRRPPPALPLDVFGPAWRRFIEDAAKSAACPLDYVAGPLLSAASGLIGNARWAQATPGWSEPPHLWCGVVGDSGNGKSPGADALMRGVLPDIERRMQGDFPDQHRDWMAASETYSAAIERWKAEVRIAQKAGNAPPAPPANEPPSEPQAPRLRQSDVTIERVATLLASAAPKGLMIVRDELAGWLLGMNAYNDAGRQFWLEAYGGRSYRVERQKHPQPIVVDHLAVSVSGGTQPEKLAAIMHDAPEDDGLLARFCWFWPDAVPFALADAPPSTAWATEALDRLRLLTMQPPERPGDPARPVMVPLASAGRPSIEAFARDMQERQQGAAGLMRSAYGKARGTALRLSLVLECLWWCAKPGFDAPPAEISKQAFLEAACLVSDYLMPMAERVYGDSGCPEAERHATTLARWIVKTRPAEVHVRTLQRDVRLPGLTDAALIHAAAGALIEAGWLSEHPSTGAAGRPRAAYHVNGAVWTPGT